MGRKSKYDWEEAKRLFIFGDNPDTVNGLTGYEVATRTGIPKTLVYRAIENEGWVEERKILRNKFVQLVEDSYMTEVTATQVTMLSNIGRIFDSYSGCIGDIFRSLGVFQELKNRGDTTYTDDQLFKMKLDVLKALGGVKGLTDLIKSAEILTIIKKNNQPEAEDKVVKTITKEQMLKMTKEELEEYLKINASELEEIDNDETDEEEDGQED